MKYGLSDAQLKEIVAVIKSYDAVDEAIIFGSRAIDTFKEASDIDIAIKGKNANFKLAAKIKNHFEEESYLPFFFDIISYNTIDNKNLKKHIFNKGKTIYRKGWRETKLGDVVTFQRGFDLPTKNRTSGEYPLMVSNGQDGTHNDYKVEAPGVVTGRSGTLGHVFLVKKNYWPLNTTLWVKDFHGNNVSFIYYFLKTLSLERYNAGSGVPTLNRNHIHPLPIIIPPLPEQKAIAEVLSSLDDKIDLLHRQNKTLEDMAQALFRKWFIEEASTDWEVGKLGDEFDFTMGQSPPGSSYNEEAVGIPMFQGNADFGFRFPKNRVYTTEPKRFADKYDTLISVRAPVGEQNMANDRCCIGRGVAAFRYKKNKLFYTYTYFKMMSLMDEVKQFNHTGTVFGSIGKSDFMNFDITVPPDEQIFTFQELAKPLDDKIIFNQSQIRTLENFRDMLLPKLMSGAVKVKKQV